MTLLIRYAYLREATLGYMLAGGQKFYTLEEPWTPDPDGPGGQRREGDKAESCIPDGIYQLAAHNGGKFQNVWALVNPAVGVYRHAQDIPAGQKWGRSEVLIHSGNSTADVMGCIAVGMRQGFEANKPWVYESQKALNLLRGILNAGETLTIRATTGTSQP